MIFARRTPENEGVIARLEYRAIQPEDWRYIMAGVMAGHVEPAPILADLERKLQDDPASARARMLLAAFRRVSRTAGDQAGDPLPGG